MKYHVEEGCCGRQTCGPRRDSPFWTLYPNIGERYRTTLRASLASHLYYVAPHSGNRTPQGTPNAKGGLEQYLKRDLKLSHFKYTALSYCRGDPEVTTAILVHVEHGGSFLFAAIVARTDDDDDDDGGKDVRYILSSSPLISVHLARHTINDTLDHRCSSIFHGRTTNVTVNLEAALRQPRARRVTRLWVDVLCINQANRQERSLSGSQHEVDLL